MRDLQTSHHDDDFACCAMKPKGAVSVITKEEWDRTHQEAKGPGKEYWSARAAKIRLVEDHVPRKK